MGLSQMHFIVYDENGNATSRINFFYGVTAVIEYDGDGIPYYSGDEIEYNYDEFTHIDVEYDFAGGKIRYYTNGTMYGIGDFTNGTSVDSMGFYTTGWTNYYIDNIQVSDGTMGTNNIQTVALKHYTNNNQLHISNQSEIEKIEIFNLSGQSVYGSAINSKTASIDINGFVKGVYIARVISNGTVQSFKFIKK